VRRFLQLELLRGILKLETVFILDKCAQYLFVVMFTAQINMKTVKWFRISKRSNLSTDSFGGRKGTCGRYVKLLRGW